MSTHTNAHLCEDSKPAAAAAAPAVQAAAWHAALTVRGFLVAAVLGVVFCIITIKLNLGSAGMTPSLNIAGTKHTITQALFLS
jgi:shikimate kinase